MPKPNQYAVTLTDEWAAAIDAWRSSMLVVPSRSAALSALVEQGFRAVAPSMVPGAVVAHPAGRPAKAKAKAAAKE